MSQSLKAENLAAEKRCHILYLICTAILALLYYMTCVNGACSLLGRPGRDGFPAPKWDGLFEGEWCV